LIQLFRGVVAAGHPTRKRWSHNTREEIDMLIDAIDDAREIFG